MFFAALEPRLMTRWDAHKFGRDAYNAGIRFIGGCCGIEPYHIRAVAEEVRFLFCNSMTGKQYITIHAFQCDLLSVRLCYLTFVHSLTIHQISICTSQQFLSCLLLSWLRREGSYQKQVKNMAFGERG